MALWCLSTPWPLLESLKWREKQKTRCWLAGSAPPAPVSFLRDRQGENLAAETRRSQFAETALGGDCLLECREMGLAEATSRHWQHVTASHHCTHGVFVLDLSCKHLIRRYYHWKGLHHVAIPNTRILTIKMFPKLPNPTEYSQVLEYKDWTRTATASYSDTAPYSPQALQDSRAL